MKQEHKKVSTRNRGKFLESLIDNANIVYRAKWIADIDKIPTALQVIKDHGRNVTARKETPKWVDYVGVTTGLTVIFDAKETKGKSLPLGNISTHQYKKLKNWHDLGHISFLIVRFSDFNIVYRLPFETLQDYYDNMINDGARKSIPLKEFENKATEIKQGNGMALDYLDGLY